MKKTGFNGHIYDFSVDNDAINVEDIFDIRKYLIGKKWNSIKMFGFLKQIFVSAMMFFGCSLFSVNSLECVSINNEECKLRPEIVNVNSNESIFYPFTIRTSKCSGNCNNINDPKLCVPDVVKKF